MPSCRGYAAHNAHSRLAPFDFERREPGPSEMTVEILYCGVCHTDLHQARNEWGGSRYPIVPGHEIVGRVVAAGSAVTRFKVGGIAAIGVLAEVQPLQERRGAFLPGGNGRDLQQHRSRRRKCHPGRLFHQLCCG